MGALPMKQWYKSKILWANGIAFLVAVAGPVLSEWIGYTGEVPDSAKLFVLPAILLLNMVLRYFFTNTSLRA